MIKMQVDISAALVGWLDLQVEKLLWHNVQEASWRMCFY